MDLILLENSQKTTSFFSPPPSPPQQEASSSSSSLGNSLENRISPSILLIIVILAAIFFISGLLHLLVRYLLKPNSREPEDIENVTALQGQLQQLFHLHDAGVDQSFIDNLPIFQYKAIIGLKDPFDCAVCLCEFEPDDKLRLLPKCSHAFHLECIDTWLFSHSTCPLCRSNLIPEFSPACSPVVFVLESGSDSSREIAIDHHRAELGSNISGEDEELKEELPGSPRTDLSETAKVVPVKLGKFRNVDSNSNNVGEGSSSSSTSKNVNFDQRRCFSMGAFEYVMDDASLLQVAVKPMKKKNSIGGINKKTDRRFAMSECDCNSKREGFKGFNFPRNSVCSNTNTASSNLQKKDSFSISKIWMRSKGNSSVSECGSRRAFSFRLPVRSDQAGISEYGSDCGMDIEAGSCCNQSAVSSRIEPSPSFARRTLLWIMGTGRPNRVGSHG